MNREDYIKMLEDNADKLWEHLDWYIWIYESINDEQLERLTNILNDNK